MYTCFEPSITLSCFMKVYWIPLMEKFSPVSSCMIAITPPAIHLSAVLILNTNP